MRSSQLTYVVPAVHLRPCRNLSYAVAAVMILAATNCPAITVGHVDNFNDGTTQGWQVGSPDIFPVSQADLGPNGAGDHALWMATQGAGGSVAKLLVFNTGNNWTGDWTAAGVTRIELDVQGPSSNAFPLALRLGIVGPEGGPFNGGSGDTYVTPAIQVPSDNQWHRITFDVLASDFILIGGEDIDDALSDVGHFRILHNPEDSFSGADTSFGGEFYLDNIRALADSSGPITTGDYNGNGVVDAADYVVWQDTFGDMVAMGQGADGDKSGQIDDGDYDFWRARFGSIVAASESTVFTVPEPATGGLLALATIGLMWPRSTSRRN